MKKKLLSLMVALLAITAFAATMSVTMTKRAPVTELTVISEATTWDFSKLTANTSSDYYASEGIKLTDASTPTKNDEFIYANYLTTFFTADASFKADAIAFKGEYPIRKNKYSQNGILHFKTSVAGKIVVSFNDTGSTPSATAVKRYLVVNDVQTEYWTSRENNSENPDVAYPAQPNVTSGEIAVPAGDVTITGSSAIQISKIVFTPTSDTPSTPVDIIYDFAAAATAGENPDNWNFGSAFYGWENEGKTYSRRQDYKGYTNYAGTNLPAECHVFRRSDRINGNIADGGLKCPSQKEMAINGLKAGQKVVIEYTGEGQMLYATGYDPANATAEPNTVAIIGDGNKAAISGTTAIPSGTPIHIVSTDNGYFVFRVLKNMVITKITISEETPIDPATVVKPNKVTVATGIENGTVKVSQAQAFAGDEVTVTATPNDGFKLESISVRGVTTDEAVTVTDGKFTMIADDVTVNATFKVVTSQTVTTAASGYTTLVSAYPLDFTTAAGLTAYVVAADEDIDIANSKVKLTQVTEAAANTPVILLGAANTEYTITVKADAAAVTGNLLKGSATAATTLTAGEAYLLKDGKFGLCAAGDLPAGKAYLPVPAGSASNELIIDIDGDVTGIDKVVTRDALENAKIYNLQGQEVKKAGKGIYIINGKKVVMK